MYVFLNSFVRSIRVYEVKKITKLINLETYKRQKREHIARIRNERKDITTDATDIKRTIKKQPYGNQ